MSPARLSAMRTTPGRNIYLLSTLPLALRLGAVFVFGGIALNQTSQKSGGYTVPFIICGNPVALTSETDLFELAQDVQAQPVRVCAECKAAVEKAKSL